MRTLCSSPGKTETPLARNWQFESNSLQQTVRLSLDFSFLYPKNRQLPRRARARRGGTADRDAHGSSQSGPLPVISLSALFQYHSAG